MRTADAIDIIRAVAWPIAAVLIVFFGRRIDVWIKRPVSWVQPPQRESDERKT